MNEIDLARLKDKLRQIMAGLSQQSSHATLPGVFEKLGMREVPIEGTRSKHERVKAVFAQVSDGDLPALAERYLALFDPKPGERNEIQELVWKDARSPKVPERYRREVARCLSTDDLRAGGLIDLLDRLWVLDTGGLEAIFDLKKALRYEIQRHVLQDPDYEPEYVFERLGAYTCTDARFVAFIEGLCSHKFRPDAAEQKRMADVMNEPLSECGVLLVHADDDGGYPVYRMTSKVAGNAGRPKQVIFAPFGIKPDLRFVDAVNSDVEVVSDADNVLMYDRPISVEGLHWRDLQAWWAERESVPNDRQAKEGLYRRLVKSLPNSPPQKLFFETFFATFKRAFDDLPALLPEVFLHYDPKTVKERGRDALLRQRMDFLMLLSHQTRVVIEVDGIEHYANKSTGLADVRLYAQMVAADRELRLRGYEVYHFGGVELQDEKGKRLVGDFFRHLFARYEIAVPG